jgi:hypothetical protein
MNENGEECELWANGRKMALSSNIGRKWTSEWMAHEKDLPVADLIILRPVVDPAEIWRGWQKSRPAANVALSNPSEMMKKSDERPKAKEVIDQTNHGRWLDRPRMRITVKGRWEGERVCAPRLIGSNERAQSIRKCHPPDGQKSGRQHIPVTSTGHVFFPLGCFIWNWMTSFHGSDTWANRWIRPAGIPVWRRLVSSKIRNIPVTSAAQQTAALMCLMQWNVWRIIATIHKLS